MKLGQEGVVDVDGTALELAAEVVGEDLHVAREDNQFGAGMIR